jgi:hypothetical protein
MYAASRLEVETFAFHRVRVDPDKGPLERQVKLTAGFRNQRGVL